MIRHRRLDHRFVEDIPETLDPGVLYVSMRYATAVHLCCCGCEREVVTPFSPAQWKMTFDGEGVSLHPSIGSWALPCRPLSIANGTGEATPLRLPATPALALTAGDLRESVVLSCASSC
jgi:hypothetical protein